MVQGGKSALYSDVSCNGTIRSEFFYDNPPDAMFSWPDSILQTSGYGNMILLVNVSINNLIMNNKGGFIRVEQGNNLKAENLSLTRCLLQRGVVSAASSAMSFIQITNIVFLNMFEFKNSRRIGLLLTNSYYCPDCNSVILVSGVILSNYQFLDFHYLIFSNPPANISLSASTLSQSLFLGFQSITWASVGVILADRSNIIVKDIQLIDIQTKRYAFMFSTNGGRIELENVLIQNSDNHHGRGNFLFAQNGGIIIARNITLSEIYINSMNEPYSYDFIRILNSSKLIIQDSNFDHVIIGQLAAFFRVEGNSEFSVSNSIFSNIHTYGEQKLYIFYNLESHYSFGDCTFRDMSL